MEAGERTFSKDFDSNLNSDHIIRPTAVQLNNRAVKCNTLKKITGRVEKSDVTIEIGIE